MNEKNWHLRIGVTSKCNFECVYCSSAKMRATQSDVKAEDLINLIRAAYQNGITRIHWTGGEPTVRPDLAKIMATAKEIGITQQVITTNGDAFLDVADDLLASGLTRAIVSIDTLKKERFRELTGKDSLDKVLKTIDYCVSHFDSLTKLSIVTMKTTLSELEDFFEYAYKMNHKGYRGKLALKFNQFFPCNPNQLLSEGIDYWAKEYVDQSVILEAFRALSPLIPIDRRVIEGDNPTYDYYYAEKYGVTVALLSLYSKNYVCGKCHKLRVQPFGALSYCLQQKETHPFIGKTVDEMSLLISDLMKRREQLDIDQPDRKHFRGQLGELRFGNNSLALEKNIEDYAEALKG